jgi:hypothetical protein
MDKADRAQTAAMLGERAGEQFGITFERLAA